MNFKHFEPVEFRGDVAQTVACYDVSAFTRLSVQVINTSGGPHTATIELKTSVTGSPVDGVSFSPAATVNTGEVVSIDVADVPKAHLVVTAADGSTTYTAWAYAHDSEA